MPYSDAQKAVMGRWDLVVQTPGGEQPAWLEIRHSGHQTLVGQFVGWHGSARPIARVDVDESGLRFAIPPQWERGTGDLTVEETPPPLDTVLVGDLFYERDTAARVLRFVRACADRGAEVLIGDPWRAWLPQEALEPVATWRVSEASGAEDEAAKPASIWAP